MGRSIIEDTYDRMIEINGVRIFTDINVDLDWMKFRAKQRRGIVTARRRKNAAEEMKKCPNEFSNDTPETGRERYSKAKD